MPEQVDLIVANGTVVTSAGSQVADLAIDGGKFVAIAPHGDLGLKARETLNASFNYVLPGVIDGHVHFREPGLEYKEDWETGSRSAVMGGVTTVLDMPNTDPRTDNAETAVLKQRLAEGRAYCDFGFIGLLVSENVAQLRSMAEQGLVVGFKAFLGPSVGAIAPPDDGAVLAGMREIAALGLRLGFHAENDAIVAAGIRRLQGLGRTDAPAHLESRPVLAEVESIQRMGLFAHETGCPVHIFHLSSGAGLEAIDAWRAKGVDYTSETAAHYCFLTSADVTELGSILRVNPPVREAGNGDALLNGLADGRVTCIASDHSPHTSDEKVQANIWKALSGFAGVETSVRLFLTYGVNAGRLTLGEFVRATSEGPAKTWNLWPRKGAIAIGSDADLTIVDLDQEGVIREGRMHGKNNINPFEGRRTKGAAVATIVRGSVQMKDGKLTGRSGYGRLQSPLAPTRDPAASAAGN